MRSLDSTPSTRSALLLALLACLAQVGCRASATEAPTVAPTPEGAADPGASAVPLAPVAPPAAPVRRARLRVDAAWPGESAADVEGGLAFPIEVALAGVPDVAELFSLSEAGRTRVYALLEPGADPYEGTRAASAALAGAAEWHESVEPPSLRTLAAADQPRFLFVSSSEEHGPRELSAFAERARSSLQATPGVTEVVAYGVEEELIEVVVDPSRLEALGLDAGALVAALRGAPAPSPEELGQLALSASASLADIASIRSATVASNGRATLDGARAVVLEVWGGEALDLGGVERDLRSELPPGFALAVRPIEGGRGEPVALRALGAEPEAAFEAFWSYAQRLAAGAEAPALLTVALPPFARVWAMGEDHVFAADRALGEAGAELAVRPPVETERAALVRLVGADREALQLGAERVVAALEEVGVPWTSGIPPVVSQTRRDLSRQALAALGVERSDAEAALALASEGSLMLGGSRPVRLSLAGPDPGSLADLVRSPQGSGSPTLRLRTVGGESVTVPVEHVATVREVRTPLRALRVNAQPAEIVALHLPTGTPEERSELEAAMERLELPEGVSLTLDFDVDPAGTRLPDLLWRESWQ